MPAPLQLLESAKNGDLPAVLAALAAAPDINAMAPLTFKTEPPNYIVPVGGKTALHLAVENNHVPIVEALLAAGADPNVLGEGNNFLTGEAPIHVVARRGDLALLQRLLAAGANPHLKQRSRDAVPGKVPVQLAAARDHLEVVKTLLATPGKPAQKSATAGLCDAAEHGRTAMTRLLIAAGANVNKPPTPAAWAPLLTACFGGFAPVVRILLDAGADLHAVDRKGLSALGMAIWGAKMAPENNRDVESPRDHKEVVQLLLERGANLTVGTWMNRNPLQFARDFDDVPLIKRLLPVLEEHAASETAE